VEDRDQRVPVPGADDQLDRLNLQPHRGEPPSGRRS
jgi:hypothetical protein